MKKERIKEVILLAILIIVTITILWSTIKLFILYFKPIQANNDITNGVMQISPLELKSDTSDANGLNIKKVKARVTGYAPHDNVSGICNDGNPNLTSKGVYPERGIVAVDPKLIPYGTEMLIPGYGYGQALDTGGILRAYGKRGEIAIDLVFDTYEEAVEWGVKEIDIYIVEVENGKIREY